MQVDLGGEEEGGEGVGGDADREGDHQWRGYQEGAWGETCVWVITMSYDIYYG